MRKQITPIVCLGRVRVEAKLYGVDNSGQLFFVDQPQLSNIHTDLIRQQLVGTKLAGTLAL